MGASQRTIRVGIDDPLAVWKQLRQQQPRVGHVVVAPRRPTHEQLLVDPMAPELALRMHAKHGAANTVVGGIRDSAVQQHETGDASPDAHATAMLTAVTARPSTYAWFDSSAISIVSSMGSLIQQLPQDVPRSPPALMGCAARLRERSCRIAPSSNSRFTLPYRASSVQGTINPVCPSAICSRAPAKSVQTNRFGKNAGFMDGQAVALVA